MTALRKFEMEAIALMAADVLTAEQMRALESLDHVHEYIYTGSGYFLTLEHPVLPSEKQTLSLPFVVGNANDICCGFVAFLGGGKITLECHTWGDLNVPEGFRDMDVLISTREMNMIDLRS